MMTMIYLRNDLLHYISTNKNEYFIYQNCEGFLEVKYNPYEPEISIIENILIYLKLMPNCRYYRKIKKIDKWLYDNDFIMSGESLSTRVGRLLYEIRKYAKNNGEEIIKDAILKEATERTVKIQNLNL